MGGVYWIIQDGNDINVLTNSKLAAVEEHPIIPSADGNVDWTQASNYAKTFVENVHLHKKKGAINVFPGFDETKLGRPSPRMLHRNGGKTLGRQLDIASQAGADFVVISSFTDWQENTAIAPGWDFEDYAGDPYQYLKIVAEYVGTTFIPPPLPSKDSLDPLIWGKLFGIDKAGPVSSQISFDSDSIFSTTLSDDMSNVATAEYFVDGFHNVRLKATNAENGLHLRNITGGMTSVVNRGGRDARSTDGVTSFYISIDDIGITPGDYDAYVFVEYFDSGTRSFGIQFSSTSAPYNFTSIKLKENTNTWKTHVFHLDHATFDGKVDGGSDFRLFQFSDSLIVARLGIILTGKGSPMFAQDGSFNSLNEQVYHSVAAINDGDLHGIYVHGKDTVGNWGMSWASLLTTLPWTVTAPTVPTLASPIDSSKDVSINPSLSWSSVTGATSYRLQVSTSLSFSSFVLDDSTIVTTSRQVGPLLNNTTYYWRARAKNYKGTSGWSPVRSFTTIIATSVETLSGKLPKDFSLGQNFPNPFNPSTYISFSLPSKSFVSLKVFDLIGREVATIVLEEMSAGNHSRQWNGNGVPSGVYFYRLQAGAFVETKKLVLLK